MANLNKDVKLEGSDALAIADDEWLKLAASAYSSSETWMESNLRGRWRKNIAMFHSRHPEGSKYHTPNYAYRSKIYRPKTRSGVRKNEAAAVAALFGSLEVLDVRAEDSSDVGMSKVALFVKNLCQVRLDKTIPWFKLCVASLQETNVIGTVVSHQSWKYRKRTQKIDIPVLDDRGQPVLDETGQPIIDSETRTTSVVDQPEIRLVPPENIRIDAAADWLDPINTSPFVIEMIPMYLQDVKARMRDSDSKTGEAPWKTLTDSELRSASQHQYDSLRQYREKDNQDPKADHNNEINDFTLIWVHKNIVRRKGRDMLFYTIGVTHRLTDPVELIKAYPHLLEGERPYVAGHAVIEAFRTHPAGTVELTEGLQTAINEVQNSRFDNVRLVLNKRYKLRNGANVDVDVLEHNVPGSVIYMDNPKEDMIAEEFHDVTGSSYNEQDRLNMDFDELAGGFSTSSVATNRALNETVGGMKMMAGSGNMQTDYVIRTWVETWVEPVLRQLMRMEQLYETNEQILTLAGQRAEVSDMELTDDMLLSDLQLRVNVGMGATDPQQRLANFSFALTTIINLAPTANEMGMDIQEIANEIFGASGYRDGKRFWRDQQKQDPQVTQLQKQLDELLKVIETKQVEQQARIEVAKIGADKELQIADQRMELDYQVQKDKVDLALLEAKIKLAGNDIKRGELILQKEALIASITEKEEKLKEARRSKSKSDPGVMQRDQYGNVPYAEH